MAQDFQSIIDQITQMFQNNQIQRPDFDDTGLYDQNEALLQGEAEFNPWFDDLRKELGGSVDTQKRYSTEDLNTSLGNIGTGETRAGEDLATQIANINQQRGYAQQDSAEQLRQRQGQIGQSVGQRGLVHSGGNIASQNFAGDQNKQALQRAMTGYGTQERAAQLGNTRQLQNYGTQRTAAQTTDARNQYGQDERLRTGTKTLGQQEGQAIGQYQNDAWKKAWDQYMSQYQ